MWVAIFLDDDVPSRFAALIPLVNDCCPMLKGMSDMFFNSPWVEDNCPNLLNGTALQPETGRLLFLWITVWKKRLLILQCVALAQSFSYSQNNSSAPLGHLAGHLNTLCCIWLGNKDLQNGRVEISLLKLIAVGIVVKGDDRLGAMLGGEDLRMLLLLK